MNQKILVTLLKQKHVSIPIILLDYYTELGLNETEFLTLLHVYHFGENGNTFPTLEEITGKMSITLEQCSHTLRGLLQRGFLMIEQTKGQQVISERYSIEPLWEKVAQLLLVKEEPTQQKELGTENLYLIFEKEFGRPLSPFECETLVMWEEQENYSISLIKAALKEAVISGKLNFRYIDRILFEWKKNGITTVEQAQQQSRKFRQHQQRPTQQSSTTQKNEGISFYNWLEQ